MVDGSVENRLMRRWWAVLAALSIGLPAGAPAQDDPSRPVSMVAK
jgi:hypothetical protein